MRRPLVVLAVVMAILCVFIATSTTIAATTSHFDGQSIALPATMESRATLLATAMFPTNLTPDAATAFRAIRQEKISIVWLGVNTASPPATHSSQTSVVGAMTLDNYDAVRTDDFLLTMPLLC